MTVAQRAAQAAASLFDRLRPLGPPPAPTPEPRPPLKDRAPSREFAVGVPPVPGAARRLQSATARVGILPPGQRQRRATPDRRHRNRRRADQGSPYGTERRSGADDRQADRRGPRADRPAAGIGLARDYFAQADPRPADVSGTTIPAHLLVRFNG